MNIHRTVGKFVEYHKNVSSGICGQRRPRTACASAQSDQPLRCPLTESLDTTECINGEQMPGSDFAHVECPPQSVVCLPTLDAFKEEVGKLHHSRPLIFYFKPSTSPTILTLSPFILSLSPLYSFVYISFFFQHDSGHLPRMPARA